MNTKRNTALGTFLKACRARMSLNDIEPKAREHRRVPGLRREEVAGRAGVSLDYYARLEQGRQVTASPSVLDAVARALRLSNEERAHLYALAGVPPVASPGNGGEKKAIGGQVRRVLDALGSTPAIVCGAYLDVLATNEAAAFLFTDFDALPPYERNALRWMLLAPAARDLYGMQWEESATEMVGMMRIDSGRYPRKRRANEITTELEEKSPLFRRLWSSYQVSAWHIDEKVLSHPKAGTLRFHNTSITIDNRSDVTVYLVIPEDRSAFEAAFERHKTTGRV